MVAFFCKDIFMKLKNIKKEKAYLDQIETIFEMYERGEISIDEFHRHFVRLSRKEGMSQNLKDFLFRYYTAAHHVKVSLKNGRRLAGRSKSGIVRTATSHPLNSFMLRSQKEDLIHSLNVLKNNLSENEKLKNAVKDIYEIELKKGKMNFRKRNVFDEINDILEKLYKMKWMDAIDPKMKN